MISKPNVCQENIHRTITPLYQLGLLTHNRVHDFILLTLTSCLTEVEPGFLLFLSHPPQFRDAFLLTANLQSSSLHLKVAEILDQSGHFLLISLINKEFPSTEILIRGCV